MQPKRGQLARRPRVFVPNVDGEEFEEAACGLVPCPGDQGRHRNTFPGGQRARAAHCRAFSVRSLTGAREPGAFQKTGGSPALDFIRFDHGFGFVGVQEALDDETQPTGISCTSAVKVMKRRKRRSEF